MFHVHVHQYHLEHVHTTHENELTWLVLAMLPAARRALSRGLALLPPIPCATGCTVPGLCTCFCGSNRVATCPLHVELCLGSPSLLGWYGLNFGELGLLPGCKNDRKGIISAEITSYEASTQCVVLLM
jgi:hypothetical protein